MLTAIYEHVGTHTHNSLSFDRGSIYCFFLHLDSVRTVPHSVISVPALRSSFVGSCSFNILFVT